VIERVRRRLDAGRDESGSAIVEFVLLVGPLFVPLVYLIIAGFETQRTAFAVAEGARQAGRAFVLAEGGADARARALFAGNLAVVDQGLPALDPEDMSVSAPRGFCRGGSVTVTLKGSASLPMLPARLATFRISAEHTEVIDDLQDLPACS